MTRFGEILNITIAARRRCFGGVIAALLSALAMAPAAPAAFPGGNGLLAVSGSFGCDGSMIATMQPDGSAFKLLTPSVCEDDEAMSYRAPDWSGDGRTLLAIARTGAPVTIDVATAGISPVPLPAEPYFGAEKASLSRDGRSVAYTRQVITRRGARFDIWVANVDGTNNRRLRTGVMPRFSPNGRTIAFVTRGTSRGITCAPGGRCKGSGTWLMNARTGKVIRRLAVRPAGSLDWAPDGKRVLYASERSHLGDDTNLYVVGADGKNRRKLTRTPARAESEAVFSPDGRRIAFVARTQPDEEEVQFAVYTMTSSARNATRIYRSSRSRIEDGNSLSVSWQPLP